MSLILDDLYVNTISGDNGDIITKNASITNLTVGLGSYMPAIETHTNAILSTGTSSTQQNKLILNGVNKIMKFTSGTSSAGIQFNDTVSNSSFYKLATSDGLKFTYSAGDLTAKSTFGTDLMKINTSGNIGIGVSNPTERLDVSGNIRADDDLLLGSQDYINFNDYRGPVASGDVHGVNITALNERIRAPYGTVKLALGTWTQRSILNYEYRHISYSPELRLFISTSNNGPVLSSSDCITWTSRYNDGGEWQGTLWIKELSLYVAVGSTSIVNNALYSSDGVTWSGATTPQTNNWRGVAWSPQLSRMVAVGASGTTRAMYSSDGKAWVNTSVSIASRTWRDVVWSPELGIFVAVADTGVERITTSTDGITWTTRSTAADSAINLLRVAWSPELMLLVAVGKVSGSTGGRIMYSSNGISWTVVTIASTDTIRNIAWSPEISAFVACENTGYLFSSRNGTTWTQIAYYSGVSWVSICWSKELSIFTLLASTTTVGGSSNLVATSRPALPDYSNSIISNPSLITVDTAGDLGLGISAPSYKLQLSSDSAFKPGSSTWTIASDERIKEDIQDADLDICYQTIKSIPLRRFRWRDGIYKGSEINNDWNRIGFIAQEYKGYFPKDVKEFNFTSELINIDNCLSINTGQAWLTNIGAVKKIIQKLELEDYKYSTEFKLGSGMNDIKVKVDNFIKREDECYEGYLTVEGYFASLTEIYWEKIIDGDYHLINMTYTINDQEFEYDFNIRDLYPLKIAFDSSVDLTISRKLTLEYIV
jgi:hypothetical protein